MSIGISREDGWCGFLKTEMFPSKILACLAELENAPGKKCHRNLENGVTVWYRSDLGNFPEVCHGGIKQRVYDAQRELIFNYKTALGKEEALHKVVEKI